MARPKAALILTDDEPCSSTRRPIARARPRIWRRARIILTCAEGLDSRVVARRLRMSEVTVCKWRGRFIRERLDGLFDEPRPGAPRRVTDAQAER
jgi:transposase